MMTDGVDPRELELPIGYGSTMTVEKYAREYVQVNPRSSLAIMYGIAAVGVCVAAQGGWVLQAPIRGGGHLEVPVIQHFMGVAPSGWRKSTALDAARRPLMRALGKGVRHRTDILGVLRRGAEQNGRDNLDVGQTHDPKQYSAVFNAGICPHTLLKDPTVEALRDFVIANGGVGGVLSAEADVYRNISAYSNDSGSLTFFLDLWSQEAIATARVSKGLIHMEEVALLQAVLFQSDVFAEVTGGSGPRATGADSFISRGMFGRIWVVRAQETGGFEALAQQYNDADDFTASGVDGMEIGEGEKTPLGWALHDYEEALGALVHDSDRYRALKATRRQWELARNEHGTALQVPEVDAIPRQAIHLDASARLAYRRLQRLQLSVEAAIADDQVDEDVRLVFNPLAARITQHVLREALVTALGSGYRVVTGEMIEDAATRVLPWRIAHTADALLMRASEMATDRLARVVTENPRVEDRSVSSVILKVMAKMANSAGPQQRMAGFSRSEIREQVRGLMPKSGKAGIGQVVDRELAAMAASPGVGVQVAPADPGALRQIVRYQIDDRTIAQNLAR